MHSDRAISSLIGLIYDAAGDSSRWPAFLDTLRRTLRAEGANLFAQDLRDNRFSVAAQLGFDEKSWRSYETYYRQLNVYLKRGNRELQTGRVCLGQSLCPDRVASHTEFYNDWIAPQKLHYGVLGVIYRKRSLASMVGAVRARGKPSFGAEEVSLVELLIPHLQRAVSLHRRISDLKRQSAAASDALDHWSMGVVLLDSKGQVVLMNRKAEEIISQKDGLAIMVDGELLAAVPSDNSSLRAFIRDATATRMGRGGNSGGAMPISRPSLRRPFNVFVTPLFAHNALAAQKAAVIALFMSDPEGHDETNEAMLQRLYGLTPAEATVAGHLAAGEALSRVAEDLQVSMNTARTHLKRVFDKTGTNRQAELVKLLLRSPAQVRLKH